jgi:hypothetical protein
VVLSTDLILTIEQRATPEAECLPLRLKGFASFTFDKNKRDE